jgi:hypothetical protein
LTKKALLIAAISLPLFNIYQAITTTVFVSGFPFVVTQLPNFITRPQPNLQLSLFVFQELAGVADSYLRLKGSIFALNCAFLYSKRTPTTLKKLSKYSFLNRATFFHFFQVRGYCCRPTAHCRRLISQKCFCPSRLKWINEGCYSLERGKGMLLSLSEGLIARSRSEMPSFLHVH